LYYLSHSLFTAKLVLASHVCFITFVSCHESF